jgi:RNA polymerase primary sigma factor
MFLVDPAQGCLSEYLYEISQHPLLTPADELRLAEQLSDGRRAARQLATLEDPASPKIGELERRVELGMRARQTLIESNLRLVVAIARRYRGNGLSMLDLIQEGNIGLQIGVEKYDCRKGYRLSTYVFWWIRQTITRALANDSRTIRLPAHAGELIREASAAEQQLQAELGRTPTLKELAARVGVPTERLGAIRMAASTPMSLDVPMNDDSRLTRGDMVVDDSSMSNVEAVGEQEELESEVANVVATLPPREREVLQLRYGLANGNAWSLAQIGQHLGVTRERARQLENQALRRLRVNPRLRRALADLARA